MQETLEVPPERSVPWHSGQETSIPFEAYSCVAAIAWSEPPAGLVHPETELPDGGTWFGEIPPPLSEVPEVEHPAASAAAARRSSNTKGHKGQLFQDPDIIGSSFSQTS